MQEYPYYVSGEFRKSGREITSLNPATEEPAGIIYEASVEDVNLAIASAKSAYKEWAKKNFKERAELLRTIRQAILDNLQELAELESKDIGKPLKESLFVDVPLSAEVFGYYASFLESLEERVQRSPAGEDIMTYIPYGVCGVFLPYNVPLMIFGFSAAAALAAGNAVIVKPSEHSSLSMLRLARILHTEGVPLGLISIITGRGDTVGRKLAESEINLLSFTGSRQTLKKIIEASSRSPKKIICELGGANILAVFQDADLEEAKQNILGSVFMKQGQICIGTSLVLVEEGIYDKFVASLVESTKKIKTGDPFNPLTGMGAVISKERLLALDEEIKDVVRQGGKILCGGEPLKGKGYFYPATLIESDRPIYEEFFGPVAIVVKFKDRQELEKVIDTNPTGLVLQVWTKDITKARNLAFSAYAGTVWINTFAQMSASTPFGGVKQSGFGRNLGREGFFEYCQAKHIGIGLGKSPVSGWFGV